jgi:hypothetical protein
MMRFLAFLVAALCWVVPASAQVVGADIVTGCGSITYSAPAAGGNAHMTQDTTGSHCVTAVMTSQYPQGAAALTANAAGSTGAVVGTFAATASKTNFICGFNVQAIGGTATVGPITIAGLVGSSQVYQTDVNSATVGKTVASATFSPCIPASAPNVAITVTTTANGTATAVDVNAWGYRF